MAKGLLNHILEGNAVQATELIESALYHRTGIILQERKKQVIAKMFEHCDDVLNPTKNAGLDADTDPATKNALYKRQFQETKRAEFLKGLKEGRYIPSEPMHHLKLREAAKISRQDVRRKLDTKGTDVHAHNKASAVPQKACGPAPKFKTPAGPQYSQTNLSGR